MGISYDNSRQKSNQLVEHDNRSHTQSDEHRR